jgi:3',5'-cyclic AMP phosphodiesterase CpdA
MQAMPAPSETRYVELIHLSDLHFGDDHRFKPEAPPAGGSPLQPDYPDLADSLIKDLSDPKNEPPRPNMGLRVAEEQKWDVPPMPKLFCMSGDFVTKGSKEEFAEAIKFVKKLTSDKALPIKPVGFVVCPGNHDLDWKADGASLRWQTYATFLNAIYPAKFDPERASYFGGVSEFEEIGVLVLSLNSETGVRYNPDDPSDEFRGDLSDAQLAWAEQELKKIDPAKLRSYIKVAMVHHHPILIPSLAEPKRSYDAINNAQKFLTRLHRHGFHLILHGHKHHPHTFHENIRNAFERTDERCIVVVAGGSCGSTGLPNKPGATQTYNRIRIHWCAGQESLRVQVVTRGLVTFDEDHTDLLVNEWFWKTIATDDRHFLLGRRTRVISPAAMKYEPPDAEDQPRENEYKRTRGNFPVAEIKPSLLPGQTNEVLLRIVRHKSDYFTTQEPIEVTWSAGRKFPKVTVTREEDHEFCAVFLYWGSALMQAEMKFEDGSTATAFVYAPMFPPPIPADGAASQTPGKFQ